MKTSKKSSVAKEKIRPGAPTDAMLKAWIKAAEPFQKKLLAKKGPFTDEQWLAYKKVWVRTLLEMDLLYAKDAANIEPPKGLVLTWWGQFSSELPEPFKLSSGGTGAIKAPTKQAAAELAEKLRQAVLKKWKGTLEWSGDEWYRWVRPDSKQMTFQFKKTIPAQAFVKEFKFK